MHLQITLLPCLWIVAAVFSLNIVQTSHHRDYFKNHSVWNRTVEKISAEKFTCSSGEIVKPHFDLYVENKEIYLFMEVFQHPIDYTINILFDNTTIDVTRLVNNTCYNVNGKCSNTICMCDVSNKSFTSAYQTVFLPNCITLGMEYRFANERNGEIIKVVSFRNYNGSYFGKLHIQIASLTKCHEDIDECAKCFNIYTGLFLLSPIIVLLLIVLVKTLVFLGKKLTLETYSSKNNKSSQGRARNRDFSVIPKKKYKMKESMLQRNGLRLASYTKEPKPKDTLNDIDFESKCKLRSYRDSMEITSTSSILINMSSGNCNKQDISMIEEKHISSNEKVLPPRTAVNF